MRCPFCGFDETRVQDSRLAEGGATVRRRRACQDCGARFTTFERAEMRMPQVVKGDGRREAFSEDKLATGLKRALEKRPVDSETVEGVVRDIERRLMQSGEKEIPSGRIGEWIMEALRDLDQVAYVRFASVYRRFEDVNAFRAELDRLNRGEE
ncbi:transcriptional regulator NrdR [Thiohalorhabdus sp.]|uniref:transcriptional regulator NrdR n=1 Tax=Thiohalorhabdus sp. TaxID=3094134 RepID=UPI002FC36D6F